MGIFGVICGLVFGMLLLSSSIGIQESFATEPCTLQGVEYAWSSYDDIYTGKVVSISNQTEYVKNNPELNEWQKKADVRIDFELEHLLKGNPQTSWHKMVPLETYCPGDFCVYGADHYTIGSEIFYIENFNGNGYPFDGACGIGIIKAEHRKVQDFFDYYEKIYGVPVEKSTHTDEEKTKCKNNKHLLVLRDNNKRACVTEKTAEKTGWEIIRTTYNPIHIEIQGIPNVVHRGDFLEVFGTGDPGSVIRLSVTNQEKEIFVDKTAKVDSKGSWKLDKPIIVAHDMPYGEYETIVTDEKQIVLKKWTVEYEKVFIITPSSLKFEQGEIIKFNGTALPNKPIEFIVEDPLGKEIFTDIVKVDEEGFFNFEYQTEPTSIKGTYTIIVSQEKDKEFIFIGLGQLPIHPISLNFDNCHNNCGDIATLNISGPPSTTLLLQVINSLGEKVGEYKITLQSNDHLVYELDLQGYPSGVYTAVISKGSAQSTEVFTVGLQTGSGEIKINTTKEGYLPGDSILLLGDTAENVLLTVALMDSEGNIIKEKEIFSDKNGKISDSTFRIPSDATHGIWKFNAKNGSNFDTIEIVVSSTN